MLLYSSDNFLNPLITKYKQLDSFLYELILLSCYCYCLNNLFMDMHVCSQK